MKIVYVIDSLGKGGAERQLLLLIKSISMKHSITILVLRGKSELSQEFSNFPIQISNFHMLGSLLFPQNIFRIAKAVRFIRKERPDIIHSWLFDSSILGALATFFSTGSRLIISERGTHYWHKRRHKLVMRFVYFVGDRIVANASMTRTDIAHRFRINEKVRYIPNGLDQSSLQEVDPNHEVMEKKSDGTTIVCSVGRFAPPKRYADIIESARILLRHGARVHFLLVGGRGHLHECQRLVRKYKIDNHVTFTGEVPSALPFIAASDIYLLASSSEGMPNVLMEGMALGKPVVATLVGGVPDLVQDRVNGFLIPPFRPDLIADRILRLVKDPYLRQLMGISNSKKVSDFSSEKMVSRYEELYSNVLQRSERRSHTL